MFERACLVRYHEIGLKGRNRAQFERRFRDNLASALVGFPVSKIERIASRVAVRVSEPEAALAIAERIALIPGVQSVSPAYRVPRTREDIDSAALLAILEAGAYSTFRVESHRSNTDYDVPSMETNRIVGAFLQRETGAGVNLSAPDVTVRIDVVQGSAYVSSREIAGAGGLPVGMSGRMVALLSAGIDSPVASWRMMRRGGLITAVHFSGRPQTNDASERLVLELGQRLALTGGLARIYVVAFGDLQREISLVCPPDYRILLYRRLMLVIAEKIARAEGAKALVTGESLGQVASQTLDNIAAVDEVATMPILRPLIGSDKLEIIADARRIGTYEMSTTPHTDCCTLFMPRTPETHVRIADLSAAWDALPHARMVTDALASLSWTDFGGRGYRPPKAWPRTP
ncbi:MAG: tRNA uracil 4-sulfurtransferase ThiI [Coriobacteriia bacterium]